MKVTNEEVRKRTGSKRLSTQIRTRRWTWIGHVLRIVTKNCAKLGTRREEKERSSERNMEENSRKREKSNGVQNVDRGSKNSYRQKEMERHSKNPYTPSGARNQEREH